MKILLYNEPFVVKGNSGLGKALKHQIKAIEENGLEYTLDPKSTDYDIIHLNFYGLKSYRLAKKAHKMGKKVVYHAHSTEEDFKNSFLFSNLVSPLFKKWLCKCYRLGDAIITPTPYSKSLLDTYNLNRPIYAISNGVDTDKFVKNEEFAKEFRKYFNFKDTDKVVMSCGLYIGRKGIIDFVELAKRMPEYKFVWFGSSPLRFSPRKVRKAVHTKLPNLYFPGYVPFNVLLGGYSGADLFLFPTLEETEGVPALEAASMQIKILVRDIHVFDGWIIDGETGYRAKDVDDMEVKIKQMLNNELPDLRENAYKMAQSKKLANVGKEVVEVYNSLMK